MKYYIIGSGGFAKEVLFLTKEVFGTLENFGGFIDYKPAKNIISCLGKEFPVIDEDDFLANENYNNQIYLGIGDPKILKKVTAKFEKYSFPNLIHQNVVMDDSVKIGIGNIITAGCILTVDIKLGDFNILNLNTTVGHDTVIGDGNVLNPGSNISGNVQIGNSNLCGTNCSVLQGIEIGNNSIIGASSMVNKSVNDNVVVVGIPAKEIKKNG